MTRRKRLLVWAAALTLAFVALASFVPASFLMKASTVELFLMVLPATAFPILYTAFFPWWETPLGRALFIKSMGLLFLVDVSVVYAIFGDNYFLREHVRFTVFTLVMVGMYYQSLVIIKIKVQARRRERQGQKPVQMV